MHTSKTSRNKHYTLYGFQRIIGGKLKQKWAVHLYRNNKVSFRFNEKRTVVDTELKYLLEIVRYVFVFFFFV